MRVVAFVVALFFSFGAEAQGLPRFEQFPTKGVYIGPHREPILNDEYKWNYRTRIRNAARERPNFAGEWVLTSWGCGTGCSDFVVVNVRTGEVQSTPFSFRGWGEILDDDPDNLPDPVEHKATSRLVIFHGKPDEDQPAVHLAYLFDGRTFSLIKRVPHTPRMVGITRAPQRSAPPPEDNDVAASPPVPPSVTAVSTPRPKPGPPRGTLPYVGKWSQDLSKCEATDYDGLLDFSPGAVKEWESGCRFVKIERDGNTWTANSICEGEGEQWNKKYNFTVDEDSMVLSADDDEPQTWLRCPKR